MLTGLVMSLMQLSCWLTVASTTESPGLTARVTGHDRIELSWRNATLTESKPVLAFRLDQAAAADSRSLTRDMLGFTRMVDLAADASWYEIQFDPRSCPAVTVFRLVAMRASGESEIGLAARIVLHRPERIIPLPLTPAGNTLATALPDLVSRGLTIYRYLETRPLTGDEAVGIGDVFYVTKPIDREVVIAGGIAPQLEYHCPAGTMTGFAYPLLMPPCPPESLGEGDAGTNRSQVFLDGNAMPIPRDRPLTWGWHVYGFDSESGFTIRLPGTAHAGFKLKPAAKPMPAAGRPRRVDRPFGRQTSVRIVYDAGYQTAHYKCWDNGYSGPWDGITDDAPGVDDVINAGVVRRNRIVYVTADGISPTTNVILWSPAPPGESRLQLTFPIGWSTEKTAATITLPADAAVGDYQVQVGPDRATYCTLYVLFDVMVFPESQGGPFDAMAMASWAYDDRAYSATGRDGYGLSEYDYLNYQYWGPWGGPGSGGISGYRGATDAELGRDGGCFGQRTVELFASIHGWGAATPLEAAIHCYEVVGQRLTWTMNPYYGYSGSYSNHHDRLWAGEPIHSIGGTYQALELDVQTAEKAALGLGFSDRFPTSYIYNCGQCMNFGAVLTQSLRSIGIPAATHYAAAGAGWWGSFHVWTDVALLNEASTPAGWGGFWYKFDACDIYPDTYDAHFEGQIGPVLFDGFGDYQLNTYEFRDGPGYRGRYDLNESDQGMNDSTHVDSILKSGTTADPHGSDLELNLTQATCPFGIYDLFADASGTATPPWTYVRPGDHGYALNDSQWRHNGISYDPGFIEAENLPAIWPGQSVNGIVGGWGAAWYRIPTEGLRQVGLTLTRGGERVKFYGRWDRPVSSTASRFNGLHYDFGPVSTIDTAVTGSQLYIMVSGELAPGWPLGPQQVVIFTLERAFLDGVPAVSSFALAMLAMLLGLLIVHGVSHNPIRRRGTSPFRAGQEESCSDSRDPLP